MLPNDSILDPSHRLKIRKHAEKALVAAGAAGRYPTPVADVMAEARLVVCEEDVLNEGFLARMRQKAGSALKQALSKVLGVFDVKARLVYIDKGIMLVKQTFIKLHETAHAVLPWQRDLYGVIEDCEKTLSPEMSEQFDREANAFASEVLFQLDDFTKRAADEPFGILVPVRLGKDYGASIYSSVRRYVSTHHRTCAVLVVNVPELVPHHGFIATLRRVITSASFDETLGAMNWPETFTPDDQIGALIPTGRQKMSGATSCSLRNNDGTLYDCVAEAFTNSYQVFILIHVSSALTNKTFWVN